MVYFVCIIVIKCVKLAGVCHLLPLFGIIYLDFCCEVWLCSFNLKHFLLITFRGFGGGVKRVKLQLSVWCMIFAMVYLLKWNACIFYDTFISLSCYGIRLFLLLLLSAFPMVLLKESQSLLICMQWNWRALLNLWVSLILLYSFLFLFFRRKIYPPL